ncbi:hypothetical protein [Propionibacterium freudenreichii]|uniref:hypothetical protein n=1 Tax=Propionibacterium freudenreichii TaxID=1744 RepID=UPI00255172E9|nr:hypothetical protein [Propionibacterium freudenreichii]MDK9642898.1 hypothetical protein [Propionibacterium freudenreichii]
MHADGVDGEHPITASVAWLSQDAGNDASARAALLCAERVEPQTCHAAAAPSTSTSATTPTTTRVNTEGRRARRADDMDSA